MRLSRLDSNKYRRILVQRKKPQPLHDSVISHNSETSYSKINEFGEEEITQLRQSQKTLSETEILELVDAYRAGKTVYALAAKYGVHRVTISKTLKKAGVDVTKSKAQAKLDADEVIKMYQEYHTTGEIAKLYGVHPNCIIRCLRAHGITIRSRWDYPKK